MLTLEGMDPGLRTRGLILPDGECAPVTALHLAIFMREVSGSSSSEAVVNAFEQHPSYQHAKAVTDWDGKTPEQLVAWLHGGCEVVPVKKVGIYWSAACNGHNTGGVNLAVENSLRTEVSTGLKNLTSLITDVA